MIFLLTFTVAEAELFGYSNPSLPILGVSGNVTLETVNNSIFWNGYLFNIDRWLLIDGSNANQDIDVTPYDITATSFIGDGSQLTNLPAPSYPHDQQLNTTSNVTFNNIEVSIINATNITTQNINVTKNSTIYLGGVPISSATDINGKSIVTFGDAFINATGYFGDGGFLSNISFVNGTVIAISFNGTNFNGGNFTGDFYGTYDWTAETPWLNFNGTFLSFNETYFDIKLQQQIGNITFTNLTLENLNITNSLTLNGTTINNFSQLGVQEFEEVIPVTVSGGTGTAQSNILDFEITQIIVEPTTSSNKYRFEAVEAIDGSMIDRDRQQHIGEWNILKNHVLNDKVNISITNALIDETFNVTIKYLSNYIQ